MKRFTPTERIGVNVVERIFLDEFNWIPRHIFQSDVGLDMEVEVCKEGLPTGQLFGVQVKSGESYFKKDLSGDIIYRGDKTHLDYWLNHSLPILIILHNPKTGDTVWQKIEEKRISVTAKGWKTEIPSNQLLCSANKAELEKQNKYPLYFQRLQRLGVHRKLMERILRGDKIVIELEQWVNKTIGKASVTLKNVVDYNKEEILSETGYIYFSGVENLNKLYPWAEFQVDEEYYEEHDEDNFYSEYGVWDPEEKQYIDSVIGYREYKSKLPNIRPIECSNGEIHLFRLELSLNSLGESFLTLNGFLENGV